MRGILVSSDPRFSGDDGGVACGDEFDIRGQDARDT